MTTTPWEQSSDAAFGSELARSAGELLQQFRRDYQAPVGLDPRSGAMSLRDGADAISEEHIAAALALRGGGDAVLSEEAADSTARDTADRVWIIDPLDGTWEYGMGRADWAVHVALWQRLGPGDPGAAGRSGAAVEPGAAVRSGVAGEVTGPTGEVVFGAVAVPDEGLLLRSDAPPTLPPPAIDRPLRIIASRSRPPFYLAEVAASLGRVWAELGGPPRAEVVQVGSVGAKVTRLLTGRAEVYIHDSGFYEWDVAAPLAVAQAAGLTAVHIDGTQVQFNRRPPYVTSLMVCRPEVSDAVQAALA